MFVTMIVCKGDTQNGAPFVKVYSVIDILMGERSTKLQM